MLSPVVDAGSAAASGAGSRATTALTNESRSKTTRPRRRARADPSLPSANAATSEWADRRADSQSDWNESDAITDRVALRTAERVTPGAIWLRGNPDT